MHYLEDDLELLEILPDEVKRHYLAVRQLDTQFETKLAQLRIEQREFFHIYDTLSPEERAERRADFRKTYDEIRDFGDQKLAIDEYIQLALEKYQDRVSKDLSEFKYELDQDTPGSTESIEKEFLETIAKERQSLAENRQICADSDELSFLDGIRTTSFPSTSAELSASTSRLNGHLFTSTADRSQSSSALATPKSHHHHPTAQLQQPKMQQQQFFEDFRPPAGPSRIENRLRQQTPTLSTETQSPSQGVSLDEDIFDSEMSTPPAKRKAPPIGRQFSLRQPEKGPDPSSQLPLARATSVSPSEGVLFAHPFPPHMSQSLQQSKGLPRHSPLMKMPSFAGTRTSQHGRPRKSSSVTVSVPIPIPSESQSPLSSQSVNLPTSSSSDPRQMCRKKPPKQQPKSAPSLLNLRMPDVYVRIEKFPRIGITNSTMAQLQIQSPMAQPVQRPKKLTKRVEQMLTGGEPSPSTPHPHHPPTERRSVGRPPSSALALAQGFGGRETPTSARKRRTKKRPSEFYEEEEEEDAHLEEDEGALEEEEDDVEYEAEMEEQDEASGEEEEDEDNRTWCFCKQKSHGDMVACDNKQCKFEWFHYTCVGITAPPKGKWYCPTCSEEMVARRSRSRE